MTAEIASRPSFTTLFTAVWNRDNLHLKREECDLTVKGLFASIAPGAFLKWTVGAIAKRFILPASWLFPQFLRLGSESDFRQFWYGELGTHRDADEQRFLRERYSMKEYAVCTPDNALLQAYCYKHAQADQDTPTVLLFNTNGTHAIQEPFLFLIFETAAGSTPCNFVSFDYRTVGNSTGELHTANDLFIDGNTMVQFIEKELKTPKDKIILYGWSVGGGVAANGAHDCNSPIVLDRTFSTISKVMASGLTFPLFFWLPPILRMAEWEIDTAAPIKEMQKKGRPVLVVHHPGDPVIKNTANIYAALDHSLLSSLCLGTESLIPFFERIFIKNHHMASLFSYEITQDDQPVRASKAVMDFILNPPKSGKN